MIPTKDRLLEVVDRLVYVRLLVVGDIVADEYIVGRPARLSREAPIPIFELTRKYLLPGGAGNAAHNAAVLGSSVWLVGVVGDDAAGVELRGQLGSAGIHESGLVVDATRHTSTKTRIIGGDAQTMPQQVARVDHIDRTMLNGEVGTNIAALAEQLAATVDVILLSDYDIATLTPGVIESVLTGAHALNKLVVVDAHDQFSRFHGIHSATPNQPEAEAELGQSLADDDALTSGAQRLVDRMQAKAVLITRGGLGMALYEREHGTHFIPVATYSEVRDATGAGDTAATVYTLALGGGATPLEAAHLANLAAGVAVCKSGVATVSSPELREAVRAWKPQ